MTNKYTVSVFKKASDVSNAFNKSVFYCLQRIKEGKSKSLVEWLRNQPQEVYDKEKKNLPSVCFNGTFNYRSQAGLIQRSGLIILDFDKFNTTKEAIEFKESLSSNEYIFAAWLSPSNKGVKVLVKITTDKAHKGYFKALKDQFSSDHWDDSGSDISRLCFESYDPDIYINAESLIFDEVDEPDASDIGVTTPVMPITSENNIIENLVTWWNKKYGLKDGAMNNNLFILAAAMNNFGIHKSECLRTLLSTRPGSKENEITMIVKSAYKNTSQFGTRFFEDNKKLGIIKKQVITGVSHDKILESFPESDNKAVTKCIDSVKESSPLHDFWDYDENGKISLSPHKYKFWLEQNNYFKYFPSGSNTYTFIKVHQNLVEETHEKRIKDFCLDTLLDRRDVGFHPYDFMAERTKFFSSDFLSLLKSADIDIKEDTKDTAYLYFQNGVIEVKSDSVNQIDYLDLDGYVWKDRVTDRDFTRHDHHDSEYRKFIWLIAGQDVQKYNSFKSVIGYLLHSFKTSANNRAIIFNDETISDNPNGGSGKGLFWNALAKMKKVSMIDGKTFEFSKSFPYQTVSTDTQILVFDDVKKNFNFESLFSLITEGITLEYKGQDAIKIPIEKSPKLLITTNYTIGGIGGSFERRKFEVEMSAHFTDKYTPLDEFGHMLFDDWAEEEWLMFDNYMINCLQYYLKNGLMSHDFKNLDVRKFIKNTSSEFYEWSLENGNIPINERVTKGKSHEVFIREFPDLNTNKFKLSIRIFMRWMKEYADSKGLEYSDGNSNGERWFLLSDGNPVKAPF